MSISQYARHAGMSRQALYNWEAKQGFPARVDGKINQTACDQYLSRYRDSRDPRIKNNTPVTFGGYRLAIVKTPEWETGQIVAGGAFGLSADEVIFECRDYTLTLMDDETEDTALRDVVPSLLYVLADDT
ncbi:TPA: hypothetical protein ACXM5D_000999 [Proteus mirabilis]